MKAARRYKTDEVIRPRKRADSVSVGEDWPQRIRRSPGKMPSQNLENVEPDSDWPQRIRRRPGTRPTSHLESVEPKNYREIRPNRPSVGGVGRSVPPTPTHAAHRRRRKISSLWKVSTQGIFLEDGSRPKTKKQFIEAVKTDPSSVYLEATSLFGDEYNGSLAKAPEGVYSVVGPDPYRKRNWYATLRKGPGGIRVSGIRLSQTLDEDEEMSVPAPPSTITNPEGEEVKRKNLSPLENKEDRTVDALIEALQEVIDRFKKKEEPEEENPEEENEEEAEEINEMSEELEEFNNEPSLSQQLKAKRLVHELRKRGAISEEQELEKEAEFARMSEEQLDARLEVLATIKDEGEKDGIVVEKRVPMLRTAIATDRGIVYTPPEEVDASSLFI